MNLKKAHLHAVCDLPAFIHPLDPEKKTEFIFSVVLFLLSFLFFTVLFFGASVHFSVFLYFFRYIGKIVLCDYDLSRVTSYTLYGPSHAKTVLGHMRTAKSQISLRIRAVWSGPSLSANRIIGHYRMYQFPEETLVLKAC